jgi:hypothetical protein
MTDVYLTPDGGQDAAAMCEQAADRLSALALAAAAFADGVHDGWLGDCEEGRGWARLLLDKAVGANSLRWLLERHAANLVGIANHFRCTTRPYGQADSNAIGRSWSAE